MAYTGKREHFICDYCQGADQVSSGLPKGWCWVKTGGSGVKHACAECRTTVPIKEQREAGQNN